MTLLHLRRTVALADRPTGHPDDASGGVAGADVVRRRGRRVVEVRLDGGPYADVVVSLVRRDSVLASCRTGALRAGPAVVVRLPVGRGVLAGPATVVVDLAGSGATTRALRVWVPAR